MPPFGPIKRKELIRHLKQMKGALTVGRSAGPARPVQIAVALFRASGSLFMVRCS